jgi:hypothetical protein
MPFNLLSRLSTNAKPDHPLSLSLGAGVSLHLPISDRVEKCKPTMTVFDKFLRTANKWPVLSGALVYGQFSQATVVA